jgi:peptidoglycan/LPS O-acetylase OafA/YrhL
MSRKQFGLFPEGYSRSRGCLQTIERSPKTRPQTAPAGSCYRTAVKRIPSLDGLRAVSISIVVAGHLANEGYGPLFLKPYAAIGVRVFFVISGYLITAILLNEHDRTSSISLANFYIRRAYRIFPAALFFMLTIFVVYWRTLRWQEMVVALLYLVNYFPQRPWVLGHLWSLSVEEQFYFLWPTALKKWHRHRVAILLGVAAFSPVYTAALFYLKWFPKIGIGTLPTVADNLAVGCLVATFATRWPRIRKPLFALLILAVIAIPMYDANTASRTLLALFVLNPILTVAIGGILIHVVQNPYRILNLAPAVWLGQISYSLYLWQQPFMNPASPMRYGLIWAMGMACASYYLVERPLLRYRDGRVRSTSDKPIESAAA